MKSCFTIFLLSFVFNSYSQTDSVQLLKPTGNFSVGTFTYEWTDPTRELKYASDLNEKRTIIVQIWYPASIDSNEQLAPYNAVSGDYRKVKTNSYLRPKFNKQVTVSNLILISPGRGTERFLYSTLAEDLASHGFMVASVDMPLIGYSIYADGYILKPSTEFQTPPGMMAGPYEKVDSFYERPTEIGYRDLLFVIQKISELNKSDLNYRFTGKINVKNIGVFGHSLGGRIAGELASKNKNIKAYISMEGIPPRNVRYQGKLRMTTAMLCSSGTWPYAVDNYNSLIDNRTKPVYMIELPDFGHNSVTDNPMIYPNDFNYKINPSKGLDISRTILTSYFKTYLNGNNNFDESLKTLTGIKFTKHD